MEADDDMVKDLYVMVHCVDPLQPRSAIAKLLPVYLNSSAPFTDITTVPPQYYGKRFETATFRCIQIGYNKYATEIRMGNIVMDDVIQYPTDNHSEISVRYLDKGFIPFAVYADLVSRKDLPQEWSIRSSSVQPAIRHLDINRPCYRVTELKSGSIDILQLNTFGYAYRHLLDPDYGLVALAIAYDPAIDKINFLVSDWKTRTTYSIVNRREGEIPFYNVHEVTHQDMQFSIEYLPGWPSTSAINITCPRNADLPAAGEMQLLPTSMSNDDDLMPPEPPCVSRCWSCFRRASDEMFLRCPNCLRATYCSRECLLQQAYIHKHSCKFIRDTARYDLRYGGGGDVDDFLKKRVCQFCKSADSVPGQFKQCGACHEVIYCSRECRIKDLPSHRDVCAYLVRQSLLKRKEEKEKAEDIEGEIETYLKIRRCQECKRREPVGGPKFKRCAGCREALYCSPKCQFTDWKKHQPVCDYLVKMKNESCM